MTLTELRYIVAVAREKHFGRAAEACFVSQPTLSVAIKKLEEELELKLFERGTGEVSTTPLGALIVQQAPSVLDQAAAIKEIAKRGQDPLSGPLRLGLIYTIGPYLLPELVRQVITLTPQMPLLLQENFTARLLDMLRGGALDCAIMAEPFPDTGLAIAALYDEPFMVAVPSGHPLAARYEAIAALRNAVVACQLDGVRGCLDRPAPWPAGRGHFSHRPPFRRAVRRCGSPVRLHRAVPPRWAVACQSRHTRWQCATPRRR